MKKHQNFIFSLIVTSLVILTSCEESDNVTKINSDFDYLKGTWIDKESFGMQFIDFYSENQARFGKYSKNFEKYDSFKYRIINSNQIAIDWIGDSQTNETFHDLIKNGNDTIEISDLTIIPENPNKIYLRREIVTERQTDTIVIGHNQEYFDFDNDFRLRIDSILTDSRCATGANCVWEGNSEVRLDLILQGNRQHFITLNTNQDFRIDTLIESIKYRLVGLLPYPDINKTIDNEDYIIKVMIEKK